MASRHEEGEKFSPKTHLFMPGLLLPRGSLHLVEWGWKVCCCLFVWDKKEKKKKFPPRVEQFPKHIWSVFLKWLSSNLCAFVCICVCLPQTHFVDDAVGILDAYQSLSRQKTETIYLFLRQACTHKCKHTHTHSSMSYSLPLLSCVALLGCLGSSRNRECVTKHILSDSHAIFPWSRPCLPFMLRLPAILRRRLLWTRGPAVRKEAALHNSYTHHLIPEQSQGNLC